MLSNLWLNSSFFNLKGLMKYLPVTIIFLTGCSPVKVKMNVDASLGSNSVVYNLNYSDSLADKISGKRLNVSFGPYRVTDADLSWTRTKSQAEDPDPLLTFKEIKKSGNTTTTTKLGVGPTSFFGFSRPPAEGEATIDSSFRTVKYKFNVGKKTTWNALCIHRSEKRIVPQENSNSVDILSANFSCLYKEDNKASSEPWLLSIDYGGAITMTQKGNANTLAAYSTGGNYVKPDGQITKLFLNSAGYTWKKSNDNNDKNVAAISVKEETPRVWLHKGNKKHLNHILSMANTGLLIYHWEIQH
ncbi:MAG: hypothetical protein OEY78_07120 [Gammaproteobacteria bacterium]|nr:hypothetical protein [Gammaproteobacteria bacterium]